MVKTVLIIMATWIVIGCTPRLDSNGCYGYWYDPGLKRGTRLENQKLANGGKLKKGKTVTGWLPTSLDFQV